MDRVVLQDDGIGGLPAGSSPETVNPGCIGVIRQQRNDALDRIAALEVDLAAAHQRASWYSNRIVEMAEKIQALEAKRATTQPLSGEWAAKAAMTPEKRREVELYGGVLGEPDAPTGGPEPVQLVNRQLLTEKQRANLDAANSSVQ